MISEPGASPVPARVDSAHRFIAAPPKAVYAAFANARAMEQWVPPNTMTATMLRFDFREGGSYLMRLVYPDSAPGHGKTSDNADEVEVRFVRLAEAKRIEQTVAFQSDDPAFAGVMRMTWTFDEAQGGTRVTIRAEDVPSGIRPEEHQAGMDSTLGNLAAFLENTRG